MRIKLLLGLALTTSITGNAFANPGAIQQAVMPVAADLASQEVGKLIDGAFSHKGGTNEANNESNASSTGEAGPSSMSEYEQLARKYSEKERARKTAVEHSEQARAEELARIAVEKEAAERQATEEAEALEAQEKLAQEELQRQILAMQKAAEERTRQAKEAAAVKAAAARKAAEEREQAAKTKAEEERIRREAEAAAEQEKQQKKLQKAKVLDDLRNQAERLNKDNGDLKVKVASLMEERDRKDSEMKTLKEKIDNLEQDAAALKENVAKNARMAESMNKMSGDYLKQLRAAALMGTEEDGSVSQDAIRKTEIASNIANRLRFGSKLNRSASMPAVPTASKVSEEAAAEPMEVEEPAAETIDESVATDGAEATTKVDPLAGQPAKTVPLRRSKSLPSMLPSARSVNPGRSRPTVSN